MRICKHISCIIDMFLQLLYVATGMKVARSRFLPVKTTSDLLLVMSDLYNVKHGSLTMSPKRGFLTVPLVKLGDMNFRKVCVDTIPQLYRLA